MLIKFVNQNAANNSGVRSNVNYGNMLDQERYISVINRVKDLNVLDCACGVGWGSYLIANANAKNVTAVDLSLEAIEAAKKYYSHQNINYISTDIYTCEFKNKFDLITSFETIEHVENPVKFLKTLYKFSHEDTILFLSTPNGSLFKSSKNPENPFHINEYDKDELINYFHNSGWEVIKYSGQYQVDINNEKKINEYRTFIKRFWNDRKLRKKYGQIYSFCAKIARRLSNKLLIDPAHSSSCRPEKVIDYKYPAYHYFELKRKN